MFTCHLTKLESAVEQIRKAYPKMRPTDVALVGSALVLTGRHALAVYDGNQFAWPEDYAKLTKALVTEIEQIQVVVEPKKTKAAAEEEPVVLSVGLAPNYSAGEKRLKDRKDLQSLLSEILAGGVEFVYSATDVGWQWALERANWSTISGGELARRIKVKANFTDGAVGVEMGSTTRKRSAAKAKAVAVVEEAAPDRVLDAAIDAAIEAAVSEVVPVEMETEAVIATAEEVKAGPAPETKVKATKAKAEPKVKAEPKAKAEPKVKAEPKAEPKVKAEPKPKSMPKPKAEPKKGKAKA